MRYWTESYNGHCIDFENLENYEFPIEDIAHSLSMMCRFNGHIHQFYSVGQHCLFITHMMSNESDRMKFLGLTHDVHEHVVSDIPNPVKQLMKSKYNFNFGQIEDEIDLAFYKKINVEPPSETEKNNIKYYDLLALKFEKDFLKRSGNHWPIDDLFHDYQYHEEDIEAFKTFLNLSKYTTASLFKDSYTDLLGKLKNE
jgi:uncharacterized protein